MATTNFLQFDSQQTNMLSDANYDSDTERRSGFVTGISRSILFNKTLFQSSTMSTAIANVLAARGYDAIDSDLATLQDSIDKAFSMNRGLPIGSIFPTTSPITVAPEGFLLPDGNSFDPVEYMDLANAYRIGTDTYKYGQEYVDGVWRPRTPDLRGYFIRVHNPQGSLGPDAGRTLGSSQESANKQHRHVGATTENGEHQHYMFSNVKIGSGDDLDSNNMYVAKGTTSGNGNYEYTLKQTNLASSLGVNSTSGAHTHTVAVDFSGTTESRPENFALTYLIVAKDSVNLGSISQSGIAWGSITGDIADQVDLQNALNAKQDTLTQGTGISISSNTISAVVMTGTDGIDAGTSGIVPAPASTDANKFLRGDGTWAEASGSQPTYNSSTNTLEF